MREAETQRLAQGCRTTDIAINPLLRPFEHSRTCRSGARKRPFADLPIVAGQGVGKG